MTVSSKKKAFYISTLVLNVISIVLISVALGTDYWIEAKPVKLVDDDVIEGAKNATAGDLNTKFKGHMNFGLFHGYKELDHGFGVRKDDITVACVVREVLCGWVPDRRVDSQEKRTQYIEDIIYSQQRNVTKDSTDLGLFNYGLWVSTIVFCGLSILCGLVACGYAIINASMKPIETINGPLGLYIWNVLAGVFSLTGFLCYVALYITDYKDNVLSPDDRSRYGEEWTSRDRSDLYWSFYLVVAATGCYAVNALLLVSCPRGWGGIAGCCGCCRRTDQADVHGNKTQEGVMMF